MKKKHLHLESGLALLALATLFCLPLSAQSAPAQSTAQTKATAQTNTSAQDNAANRDELARFDQFLDGHREIADQLRRDPSLADKPDYLKDHPDLQSFLQDHRGVRDQIKNDPNAFMREADRFNRRDDYRDRGFDRNRADMASFDRFLDSHREISEQVRRDPSLVDNEQFVKDHPALQTYLQDHQGVRDQLRDDPNAFVRGADRDNRFEDNRGRNLGQNRQELASFNQFLNNHHEISEQVRKDPSLVDNDEFVKNHPDLQTYLQDHPEVRNQLRDNPNGLLQAEARSDNREGAMDRHGLGKDMDRDDIHRHFGEFLGGHAGIAQQLSRNPSLVKNQDFLDSHPELKDYLDANPDVREQLMTNPDTFVKSSQQFSSTSTVKTPTAKPGKPNQ